MTHFFPSCECNNNIKSLGIRRQDELLTTSTDGDIWQILTTFNDILIWLGVVVGGGGTVIMRMETECRRDDGSIHLGWW